MAMKMLQNAIDNFEAVEPILMKVDFEPARKQWEKWATKEHFHLLQKNKSLFDRVPTMKSFVDEKMRGQSLVFAMGIAQIIREIKEGQTMYYVNLKITKREGTIIAEKRAVKEK